jgi:D-sedoheptulose 7-phosphate isomerase
MGASADGGAMSRHGGAQPRADDGALAPGVRRDERAHLERAGLAATAGMLGCAAEQVDALRSALDTIALELDHVMALGVRLARVLDSGGRLLVAGNGGSAAEAQHLTAELVGRYRGERRPLSAIALHAETSSLTAIANDYGAEAAFARQVEAHGRRGDALLTLSTSGRSANLLRAVEVARRLGMATWCLSGPAPNPLHEACDDGIAVAAPTAATVQEVHLLLIHTMCGVVDACIGDGVELVGRHGLAADANGRRVR